MLVTLYVLTAILVHNMLMCLFLCYIIIVKFLYYNVLNNSCVVIVAYYVIIMLIISLVYKYLFVGLLGMEII